MNRFWQTRFRNGSLHVSSRVGLSLVGFLSACGDTPADRPGAADSGADLSVVDASLDIDAGPAEDVSSEPESCVLVDCASRFRVCVMTTAEQTNESSDGSGPTSESGVTDGSGTLAEPEADTVCGECIDGYVEVDGFCVPLAPCASDDDCPDMVLGANPECPWTEPCSERMPAADQTASVRCNASRCIPAATQSVFANSVWTCARDRDGVICEDGVCSEGMCEPALAAPFQVMASDGADADSIAVQWTAVAGAEAYEVAVDDGPWEFVGDSLLWTWEAPDERAVEPGVLAASDARFGSRVELSLPELSGWVPEEHVVQVRGRRGAVVGRAGADVGSLARQAIVFDWQIAPAETGPWTSIGQTAEPVFRDESPAPADVIRWYRALLLRGDELQAVSGADVGSVRNSPDAPTGLTASWDSLLDGVELRWEPVPGVEGYEVYRDGVLIGVVEGPPYLDVGASVPSAPSVPAFAGGLDYASPFLWTWRWDEPASGALVPHTYVVASVDSRGPGPVSEIVQGARRSPRVLGYDWRFADAETWEFTTDTSVQRESPTRLELNSPIIRVTNNIHPTEIRLLLTGLTGNQPAGTSLQLRTRHEAGVSEIITVLSPLLAAGIEDGWWERASLTEEDWQRVESRSMLDTTIVRDLRSGQQWRWRVAIRRDDGTMVYSAIATAGTRRPQLGEACTSEVDCDSGACSAGICVPESTAALIRGRHALGSSGAEPGRVESAEILRFARFRRHVAFDATELTVAEFEALLGGPAPVHAACRDVDCPVLGVNFETAIALANARSIRDGLPPCYQLADTCRREGSQWRCEEAPTLAAHYATPSDCDGYRLPTEAEWEAAFRNGSADAAPWEGDPSSGCTGLGDWNAHARTCANAGESGRTCTPGTCTPAPVGSYQPTATGLFDVAGNAAEWVWDGAAAPVGGDFEEPINSELAGRRVIRGGSFERPSSEARAAAREVVSDTPADVGVRLVRSFGDRMEPTPFHGCFTERTTNRDVLICPKKEGFETALRICDTWGGQLWLPAGDELQELLNLTAVLSQRYGIRNHWWVDVRTSDVTGVGVTSSGDLWRDISNRVGCCAYWETCEPSRFEACFGIETSSFSCVDRRFCDLNQEIVACSRPAASVLDLRNICSPFGAPVYIESGGYQYCPGGQTSANAAIACDLVGEPLTSLTADELMDVRELAIHTGRVTSRFLVPMNDRELNGVLLDHEGAPELPSPWCEGEPDGGVNVRHDLSGNCLRDVSENDAYAWFCRL